MGAGESTAGGCAMTPTAATEIIGQSDESRFHPKEYVSMDDDEIRKFTERKIIVKKSVESVSDRLERYLQFLRPTKDDLHRMCESFEDELERGLEAFQRHPWDFVPSECSFKMLDSCVRRPPNGKEKGIYYALDFGGSNFRVVRAKCDGRGGVDVSQWKVSLAQWAEVEKRNETDKVLPKGLMDAKATALQMFDFFALEVKKFMASENDMEEGREFQCGFTFSFPCCLRKINVAQLMTWTKGFETGRRSIDPVEGNDVAELMNIAFARNEVPMRINSVVNDTVGTLLAAAYDHSKEHPPCLVGMILGTGFNACYVEPEAKEYGYQGTIINIESGNFNRDLPRFNVDFDLDFHDSSGRGRQHLEKLVAGAYLGEVVRRAFVRILQHRAPAKCWETESLSCEAVAAIISDRSASKIISKRTAAEKWHTELDEEQLVVLKELCVAVFDRSAAMAAVVISACARRTGHLQQALGGLSVGIDGSLYKCNEWYRERVRFFVELVLGRSAAALVHILQADDGSGKGAAILAATVDLN